jgi:hypothetical protein
MLGRLFVFVAVAVLADVPPRWDEALPRLGRGWSLLVGASLLIAAGALTWRASGRARGTRVGVLLGVALALLAVVGGLWLVRRTESFPALDEPGGAVPGNLSWLGRQQIGAPSCITVMPAGGGEASTAYCEHAMEGIDFGPGGGGWSADGELVFSSTGAADMMLVYVDPATGEHVDAIPSWRVDWPETSLREDGARLVPGFWWAGAKVTVERPDGTEARAVAIRGPHDYEFESVQWSPDGEWIALLDNQDRLLVTPADRDEPRVLAAGADVSKFAWSIDGVGTYTLPHPQLPPDVELCQGYRYRSPTCEFDYDGYAGDLSDGEVRALLLVLDEERLAVAIAVAAPEPMPVSVVPTIEDNIGDLEKLAAAYDVSVPSNAWTDPPAEGIDQPMSCLWTLYEALAERHIIGQVMPSVAALDVRNLLSRIDVALGVRIDTVRPCSNVPSPRPE